ncbi:MAG: low temperature requirement protein A [Chloroflexi bacterium]|nr:low temperature requirement protein A [Chloroflexota bacterium]
MLNRTWFYDVPSDEHHEEERKPSWLELFFDLVFVATLIQLGNYLSDNVTLLGFLQFALLLLPVWWSWSGMTFYANRYLIDDVWHRLLILGQIILISTLAISLNDPFEGLYTQFALAYAGVRIILIVMYIRAYVRVEESRPLVIGYIIGFAIAAVFWTVSAFLPPSMGVILWAVGLAIDIGTPTIPYMVKWQAKFPPHIHHMVERYGIFTIIVLGESFVKVIDGMAGTAFSAALVPGVISGTVVGLSLWWMYFDDMSEADVHSRGTSTYMWIYSHAPLSIGLVAFGVAAKKLLEQPIGDPLADKYRLLMCAAVGLFLLVLAVIDKVSERKDDGLPNPVRGNWRIAGLLLVGLLAAFGSPLTPPIFGVLLAMIFIGQVAVNVIGKPSEEFEGGHHAA